MNEKAAIDRSILYRRRITGVTVERNVPKVGGSAEAAACFSLALEHHAATSHLVTDNYIGTASAINRIIYETAVRGLWLLFADRKSVERFRSNRRPPDIKSMLEIAINANSWPLASAILDAHGTLYNVLSDLTHAGPKALAFRMSDTEIIGCYRPDDAVGLLDQADRHLYLVMLGYLSIWKDMDLLSKFTEATKEWQKANPFPEHA